MRRALRFYALRGQPHAIQSVVAVTEDPRQAALLDLILQGRPERVTTFLLAAEDDAARKEAARISDALATLALALPEEPPAPQLRARLLQTLTDRQKPRAAVLVLDMLNDHLTPGSSMEVPRARDIVPALAARLDAARTAGVPVVYVVDRHDPDDPDLDSWTTHNVAGTPGAEVWPPLAPHPGDRVVPKATYSGFVGSDLQAVLDELRVDTLVITGCLTEIGMMATASDALQRGFAVEVPADTQAGSGAVAESVAMSTLSIMPPYGAARRARLAWVAACLPTDVATGDASAR
jgi:nicotinamidase/pyrazinamidase